MYLSLRRSQCVSITVWISAYVARLRFHTREVSLVHFIALSVAWLMSQIVDATAYSHCIHSYREA